MVHVISLCLFTSMHLHSRNKRFWWNRVTTEEHAGLLPETCRTPRELLHGSGTPTTHAVLDVDGLRREGRSPTVVRRESMGRATAATARQENGVHKTLSCNFLGQGHVRTSSSLITVLYLVYLICTRSPVSIQFLWPFGTIVLTQLPQNHPISSLPKTWPATGLPKHPSALLLLSLFLLLAWFVVAVVVDFISFIFPQSCMKRSVRWLFVGDVAGTISLSCCAAIASHIAAVNATPLFKFLEHYGWLLRRTVNDDLLVNDHYMMII